MRDSEESLKSFLTWIGTALACSGIIWFFWDFIHTEVYAKNFPSGVDFCIGAVAFCYGMAFMYGVQYLIRINRERGH